MSDKHLPDPSFCLTHTYSQQAHKHKIQPKQPRVSQCATQTNVYMQWTEWTLWKAGVEKKWWPCPWNRQGHQVFMYCLTRKMRMALFSCNFSLSLEFHTMTIQKTKQIQWNSLRFEEAWWRFLNRVLHTSLVFSFVAKLVSDIFCIVTSLTLFLSAHKAAEMRVKDPPLRFEYDSKLKNYLKAERFCSLFCPIWVFIGSGQILDFNLIYTSMLWTAWAWNCSLFWTGLILKDVRTMAPEANVN